MDFLIGIFPIVLLLGVVGVIIYFVVKWINSLVEKLANSKK